MSDSERVKTLITSLGYKWTDHEEEADLLGILSCSVRQKSIDKVYSRIAKWNKWKIKKSLLTFVSACILPADKEKFIKMFDFVFPITDLHQFPDMIRQYGVASPLSVNQGNTAHESKENAFPLSLSLSHSAVRDSGLVLSEIDLFWDLPPSYDSKFEAFVPIQNGCNKYCTFCAVPYTRGREVSRSSQEILDEIQSLIAQNYKSITLLGQNVNSYGLDKKGNELSFPALLREIGKMGEKSGKDFWVYFTSPHPRDLTREVLDVIAHYKCLAKQIHLPVQSGDNDILKRMNRKHTVETYENIIADIRQILPDATLFTDIIVGFTGETEEQFKNSRLLMERIGFNMAYIAIYSPRPGAKSAQWQDDVPHSKKKERLHLLSEVLRKYSLQYNKELVGKNLAVLVSGHDRKAGYLTAYTEGRIVTRFPSDDASMIGQFVEVEIIAASELSVEAMLLSRKS